MATSLQPPDPSPADTACRACGHRGQPFTVRRLTPQRRVTRCPACYVAGLKPTPTPEELEAHYADYYLTRDKDEARRARLIEAHGAIVRYLVEHLGGRGPCSFFDYGFGSGEFLMQVARSGHRAFGTDLSSRAMRDLDEVSRATGLPITVLNLDLASPPPPFDRPTFDVVTLFQVIEHVPDPLRLAQQLAAYQRRGGLMYVECPNDDAMLARVKSAFLFGERRRRMWHSLKHPEHLHGFTRRSIRALLDAAGYEVLDCGDYAYGDGVHQVESEFWWPSWRDNPNRWTPFGASRSAIPVFDRLMSSATGAGSGLFALGRKAR